MKGQSNGPALSVVLVDYDNIYLSLKRKNEEAARRFSKDAGGWLRGIETGRLITSTQGTNLIGPRRIVLNRCYGNPAPRRNAADNSTDMNSFPFVRHHFLRSGFEVVDCPPLTAQLKNSADIKMVMDVLDYIDHQTYFEEFIVLSGDADFTPMLHRLRAHARRTIVYSNDHTATPYTAISDGEVRESDLITLLMEGRVTTAAAPAQVAEQPVPQLQQMEQLAGNIVAEVVNAVRSSAQPVPLEALADRAIRVLGHDRTVGSGWAGAGSFRDLLARKLPGGLRMSDQPPYYVFNAAAAETAVREPRRLESREAATRTQTPVEPARAPAPRPPVNAPAAAPPQHSQRYVPAPAPQAAAPARPATPAPAQSVQKQLAESPAQIQQSIARIHDLSKAPPLSPPDYRALFEGMAEELTANGLNGAQTIGNIAQRTLQHGAEIHRDDIRFVMEVVSEPDPWFEQGASPVLLSNRFRNYVIAQCRRQGMALSATEIDLIEMWFTGSGLVSRPAPAADARSWRGQPDPQLPMAPLAGAHHQAARAQAQQPRGDRWWHLNDGTETGQHSSPEPDQDADDFPRIVRSRLRT
jgi:hypothetical protein